MTSHDAANYHSSDSYANCVSLINQGYAKMMRAGTTVKEDKAQERAETACKLRDSGHTLATIAKIMDLSIATVHRAIKSKQIDGETTNN